MFTTLAIGYYAYLIWSLFIISDFLIDKGIRETSVKHILFALTCLPSVLCISLMSFIVNVYESATTEDRLLYNILNYRPFKRK